jgi:hypothetical protein
MTPSPSARRSRVLNGLLWFGVIALAVVRFPLY